jgi:hypothetical protein
MSNSPPNTIVPPPLGKKPKFLIQDAYLNKYSSQLEQTSSLIGHKNQRDVISKDAIHYNTKPEDKTTLIPVSLRNKMKN